MTEFNKAWRFLKEDFDPNDPNVMEKIEERMKQLKIQQEQVKQMRADVDERTQNPPEWEQNMMNHFKDMQHGWVNPPLPYGRNNNPSRPDGTGNQPQTPPDWEKNMMNDFKDWKEQADLPPEGNQRYPGEITNPAPDPNNPNALHPNSDRNPFKTNFAPMCEVCKATPALQNSRMCGTCTNEKEAIEQRNQQSRNNLQDRQDVSDSFIDYRT